MISKIWRHYHTRTSKYRSCYFCDTESKTISEHFASHWFFRNLREPYIYSYNFKKRILESYFKHDASKCLQLKYNWDKRTINNIEWDLYSSYYKPLSISKKAKYISLYTPHISSRKMMFEWKYCCPHCRLLPDSTTNHDHFLTYIDSWQQKQK